MLNALHRGPGIFARGPKNVEWRCLRNNPNATREPKSMRGVIRGPAYDCMYAISVLAILLLGVERNVSVLKIKLEQPDRWWVIVIDVGECAMIMATPLDPKPAITLALNPCGLGHASRPSPQRRHTPSQLVTL